VKISLKNKSSTIIASLLVTTFFFLHYFVYLDNFGNDVPFLQSYTDPPFSIQQLTLCKEKYPSYFNPFQKVQYGYQTYDPVTETYSECNLTEEAESVFTSKMVADNWNPEDYWTGYDTEGYMRPLAGGEYANITFFIIQYLIIVTFIFVLFKPEKSKHL